MLVICLYLRLDGGGGVGFGLLGTVLLTSGCGRLGEGGLGGVLGLGVGCLLMQMSLIEGSS
ncbi:hypothetical protein VAE122_1180002 [Vibrio aestuarianus]|nr:hypothetical protein VAE122_1180002 [Vibrio aestuarianus]